MLGRDMDEIWTRYGRDMDGASFFLFRNLKISLKNHNFVQNSYDHCIKGVRKLVKM